MGWLDPTDLLDCGDCVIRLETNVSAHPDKIEQAFWWGKSVHQIAYVTNEGDVMCCGREIRREAINGWMPLPKGPRNQSA